MNGPFDALAELVARSEIQQLAYRYSAALENRDVEAMVDLFVPHARYGSYGVGPDALRRLTAESLAGSHMAVVLVANHLIEFQSTTSATGQVWARCYAQSDGDGYVEQLLRYEDCYELFEGTWRFLHRKHRLWFGIGSASSPLDQEPANWPQQQVGIGDIPFENPAFLRWWQNRHR